ncbi:MAG: hypothetical protein VZQ61_02500 [Christensenellaceae bacterium]
MINNGLVFDSELNKIANAIKSVSDIPNGEDMIKSLLAFAIENYSGSTYTDKPKNTKKPILKFTKEELDKMPKSFKKEFRTDGVTAHIRKKTYGKNKRSIYEIRYRRNGYNITVSAVCLEDAKRKFIEKLNTAEKIGVSDKTIPTTFTAFAEYFFCKFRKKKVAAETFRADMSRFNNYLKPAFGETKIKNITPGRCQNLFDDITDAGKGKTADEVYSILSVIFNAAIDHGIISKNPLKLVYYEKHEKEHGVALTKQEEKSLLDKYSDTDFGQSFAILLYCGLRPNELYSAKYDGKFIVAVNSKRKNRKTEYKKIPVSPMLLPFVKNDALNFVPYEKLRKEFKDFFPNHKLYDLRTTFYTRLKECNVADNAINEFVGHSLGALGNTYTDLSDEYLLKEGAKYVY